MFSSSTKAVVIMCHKKQCSDYVTFQQKCCRELILQMQVNAGLELPVSINLQLWKVLNNKCYITLGLFSKQSFKIKYVIKNCAPVFLTDLWGNKMIFISLLPTDLLHPYPTKGFYFQNRCSFGAACTDQFLFAFRKHKHTTF